MEMTGRFFENPLVERHAIICPHNALVNRFHQEVLPDYKPTKLTKIESHSEYGEVFVKEESDRFGLPAFKVLGSSFATFIELCRMYNLNESKATMYQLRESIRQATGSAPTVVTATDGNHGHALAWFAKQVGLKAHVFVPQTISQAPICHIQREGAIVEKLPLDYDATVAHANSFCAAEPSRVLIQDTSWAGYKEIPRNIVEGYATIFNELEQSQVTHIICPVGVGSLAQACAKFAPPGAKIITVEPVNAPCLFRSLERSKITQIHTQQTIMAGLNCGLVSSDAWPSLRKAVQASILVTDDETRQSIKELQEQLIDCGPCGAAAHAAWKILKMDRAARHKLEINKSSRIILLVTEGSRAVQ